uniref:Uncharacterized protein n=1 Tax=Arundo donax TaxID=35708 RepID=A0A0A9HP22_ARUDO
MAITDTPVGRGSSPGILTANAKRVEK